MPLKWLDAETVKYLNRKALYESEIHGLNPGSDLEGALSRARYNYQFSEFTFLEHIAAHYGVSLVKAHAFLEGNKRTAFYAIGAFLHVNGVGMELCFDKDDDDYATKARDILVSVALHETGVDGMAEWIAKYTDGVGYNLILTLD